MEPRSDRTAVDVSLLIVRLVGGGIMTMHGAQKLGLLGGGGLSETVQKMGALGYFVTAGEFLGGLGILVGFLSRFSAAANIAIMIGAILTVHGKNGFFSQGGGFEYNLALIGLFAPILIAGPGRFTIARPLPFFGKAGQAPHPAIE